MITDQLQEYARLELQARDIAEQQAELRDSINRQVPRWDAPQVIDGLGRFIKVCKTTWSYTDNFKKEKKKKEDQIKSLKQEIKDMEKRAQVLNKAESTESYGFRFEVEK